MKYDKPYGLLCLLSAVLLATPVDIRGAVDFGQDIRPILSQNCFTCHGPDENERKADLRLDTKEGLLAVLDGRPVVVPGDSSKSELFRRITTPDEDDRMPPAKTGKTLNTEEVEKIRAWIDEGASWEQHWAFVPPVRPALPELKENPWDRNPIDRFVMARLQKEGLSPSPEAGKETLIRRVTLDLTGLPPSVQEIDAFLADDNEDAYEQLVDRLLNSPRYGEQMARYWMDAARYADTHGYHIDAERSIWPWRDWVIKAFNDNKPFDQFTVEQLAGDLLENPTQEQVVATGFNRNIMTTGEGGAIEEEYRVKYGVDRVDTTATVWLGLTMACAQCHDHKYDPVTQVDFYKLFAFFNGVAEPALDGNRPTPAPVVKVPSAEQARRLEEMDGTIEMVRSKLDGPMPETDRAQALWEEEWRRKLQGQWHALDLVEAKSKEGAELRMLEDRSILASGSNPERDEYQLLFKTGLNEIRAIRLEALTHESLPGGGAGRAKNSNFVLTELEIEAAPLSQPEAFVPVKFLSAQADYSQAKFGIENTIDGKEDTGWAVDGDSKKEDRTAVFIPAAPITFDEPVQLRVRLRFGSQFGQHAIGRVRFTATDDGFLAGILAPAQLSSWQVLGPFKAADGKEAFEKVYPPEEEVKFAETYADGTLKWSAKPEFVDGEIHNLEGENAATYLYRTIDVAEGEAFTISLGSDDAIKAWLNGEVVLARDVMRGIAKDQDKIAVHLKPGTNRLLLKVVNYAGGYGFYFRMDPEEQGLPVDILFALASEPSQRGDEVTDKLRRHYRKQHSEEWRRWNDELTQVESEKKKLEESIPLTLVMREMEKPRPTHILKRGEYDQPGEMVEPGVPGFLPPLPEGAPNNRLGLAQWLVDAGHPLTARVTVNRFWQRYFGSGLVRTTEDFGTQGERPTHPQLLDWLATEFIASGWDVKALQRLIVTSATYRQSSRVTPELLARDPANRLLARGPRFRMDAEMLRDNALAISGLLTERLGGRSVKPYEPPGLWEAVSYGFSQKYQQSSGSDLYRRSLYTFWKRQSPPPNMVLFDAPSRETCNVRRPRTNTPLQALALMNDPQFVEMSRGLAERIMREETGTPAARASYAFRLATGRNPGTEELNLLIEFYEDERERFGQEAEGAVALLQVGDLPRDSSLDPAELAAWTSVANLILNLDETITKS